MFWGVTGHYQVLENSDQIWNHLKIVWTGHAYGKRESVPAKRDY
jgi:hypothetical protein